MKKLLCVNFSSFCRRVLLVTTRDLLRKQKKYRGLCVYAMKDFMETDVNMKVNLLNIFIVLRLPCTFILPRINLCICVLCFCIKSIHGLDTEGILFKLYDMIYDMICDM